MLAKEKKKYHILEAQYKKYAKEIYTDLIKTTFPFYKDNPVTEYYSWDELSSSLNNKILTISSNEWKQEVVNLLWARDFLFLQYRANLDYWSEDPSKLLTAEALYDFYPHIYDRSSIYILATDPKVRLLLQQYVIEKYWREITGYEFLNMIEALYANLGKTIEKKVDVENIFTQQLVAMEQFRTRFLLDDTTNLIMSYDKLWDKDNLFAGYNALEELFSKLHKKRDTVPKKFVRTYSDPIDTFLSQLSQLPEGKNMIVIAHHGDDTAVYKDGTTTVSVVMGKKMYLSPEMLAFYLSESNRDLSSTTLLLWSCSSWSFAEEFIAHYEKLKKSSEFGYPTIITITDSKQIWLESPSVTADPFANELKFGKYTPTWSVWQDLMGVGTTKNNIKIIVPFSQKTIEKDFSTKTDITVERNSTLVIY